MVQPIILGLHVVTCLLIIGLVLLQRGKGADAGTGFGAGASGTVFGSRGSASFLSRATAVLATAFFVTSLTLAFFANEPLPEAESLLERAGAPSRTQTPQMAPPPADLDSPPPVQDNLPSSDAPEVEPPPVPREGSNN